MMPIRKCRLRCPGDGQSNAPHTAPKEPVHAPSRPSSSDRSHRLNRCLHGLLSHRLREAPRPPPARPQALRVHSLESGAVQGQGCQGGVGEAAAAGQAERLQPRAAPAQLHHAVVRDALRSQAHGQRPGRHAEPPARRLPGVTRNLMFILTV